MHLNRAYITLAPPLNIICRRRRHRYIHWTLCVNVIVRRWNTIYLHCATSSIIIIIIKKIEHLEKKVTMSTICLYIYFTYRIIKLCARVPAVNKFIQLKERFIISYTYFNNYDRVWYTAELIFEKKMMIKCFYHVLLFQYYGRRISLTKYLIIFQNNAFLNYVAIILIFSYLNRFILVICLNLMTK